MRYKSVLMLSLGLLGSISTTFSYAEDEFVPEVLTVEPSIAPGPSIFVLDQSWDGASWVHIRSAEDLTSIKGSLSAGVVSQFAMSKDGKSAYTASVYAKRIMSGPTESVLEEFDAKSLVKKREIILSPKMAQSAPQLSYLEFSADGKYAYVQNATPATSVTVVDMEAGEVLTEIPHPGCVGIYPALKGNRFSSLCGDGTVTSYSFSADGKVNNPVKSAKVFDADDDPVYVHVLRVDNDLVLTSFNGNLYRVSDADEKPSLVDKFSYVEGVEGEWAPGGVAVMTYNKANNVVFMTMHSKAYNGSHKNGAEEIWTISLDSKKVVSRMPVDIEDSGISSLAVTDGKDPILFAHDSELGVVYRFTIDPKADFAATLQEDIAEDVGHYDIVWIADK
ncbi:amine dehydrogenase large subunit [Methylophaga muralis]|uniref:Aralkylamine dehydrogenase heavy chain n=1 Tax=Methylophaga muralis TaxID=291169 RepID=A0A1E3GXQ0_9GAMM|nr:amine dehydrogenase large subunit [Methylophaga muralis]ODN68131.1 Aralkylamine dehydrogenase heavy chain precursor [Methylophaga muralis]